MKPRYSQLDIKSTECNKFTVRTYNGANSKLQGKNSGRIQNHGLIENIYNILTAVTSI